MDVEVSRYFLVEFGQELLELGGPVPPVEGSDHLAGGDLQASRTSSMKSGSVDSLNVCDRCGARANARQIREIADCDMPVAAAIDLVDQWVAFFGVSSSVLTMTRSTSASVVFRGTPVGVRVNVPRLRTDERGQFLPAVLGVCRSLIVNCR